MPVYRWEPPADIGPMDRLTDAVLAGGVDVLAFTSAPAAASLLRRADERGVRDELLRLLRGPVVALCVGPVTAAPLEALDVPTVQPHRSRLGAMVRRLEAEMPARARSLPVAGHWLELRGHAVLVDGDLRVLPPNGMTLLQTLARRPGRVVPRSELLAALPGRGQRRARRRDGHRPPACGVGQPEAGADGRQAGLPPRAGPGRRPGAGGRALPARGRPVSSRSCSSPTARGTPRGRRSPRRSPRRCARCTGVRVEACYADVRRPTPAEALAGLPGPVVVVPMFLAAGYHVRVDVPAQLAATGSRRRAAGRDVRAGPRARRRRRPRLRAAGMRDGDAVVLATIGSSDPHAQADGATAARRLARELRTPVTLATTAMGGPRVPDAVARLRAEGARRVAVASWLLAPGLFHRALGESGADVVAEPLSTHEAVAGLVVARYTAALAAAAA